MFEREIASGEEEMDTVHFDSFELSAGKQCLFLKSKSALAVCVCVSNWTPELKVTDAQAQLK